MSCFAIITGAGFKCRRLPKLFTCKTWKKSATAKQQPTKVFQGNHFQKAKQPPRTKLTRNTTCFSGGIVSHQLINYTQPTNSAFPGRRDHDSPFRMCHPFFLELLQEQSPLMRPLCHRALSMLLLSSTDIIFSLGEATWGFRWCHFAETKHHQTYMCIYIIYHIYTCICICIYVICIQLNLDGCCLFCWSWSLQRHS